MNFPQLATNIQIAHNMLQQNAVRAVNQNVTARNWLVGYWIVEFEQNGEDRAKYGDKLLITLAKSLKIKGLGATMLSKCRIFFSLYPQVGVPVLQYIRNNFGNHFFQTVSEKLNLPENKLVKIFQTVSEISFPSNSQIGENLPQVGGKKIFNFLSFSHIIELLSIDNPLKRTFYEIETIKGCWSVRELRRQMDTLCYERAGISNHPEKLMELVNENAETATPICIVKTPYFFDFLGLKSADVVEESDLESLLISHIQDFILELGNGFCFESRQKRMLIDNEYYFADLVFYHRILKCHVLVELKTRKFNYADMAQLNMYVAYYRENMMTDGDNPPVGILLCTDANTEMVKYATAGMDEQLFVSKYLLQLPSKDTLVTFINNELKQL